MTQSAEEVTDENHSAGMVGGHRKVLSGFLKLDSVRPNKRPHIKYLFLIHIISKTKGRLVVNINGERRNYTRMQTHTHIYIHNYKVGCRKSAIVYLRYSLL